MPAVFAAVVWVAIVWLMPLLRVMLVADSSESSTRSTHDQS
jgi:hypothetical protein